MKKSNSKSENIRFVYNLEFPSWCPELNIAGHRFYRVDDYEEKVLSLQHLFPSTAEFHKPANTGMHAHTAFVEIPDNEKKAVLEWAESNTPALMDISLLLSIFTGRDIFALDSQGDEVIISDPRVYIWGGILRCSIPYKEQLIYPESYGYNIGFEEGINQVYELIRSDEWQKRYQKGYFLFLARTAFRRQPIESTFIQCWTIWEHLFSIFNQNWMSSENIRRISSYEKISFILVEFALMGEIDEDSRKIIKTLAGLRNRLIHFGKFPESGSYRDDVDLFVRLTEFVIARILGLSPSNVLNTEEKLGNFLKSIQ